MFAATGSPFSRATQIWNDAPRWAAGFWNLRIGRAGAPATGQPYRLMLLRRHRSGLAPTARRTPARTARRVALHLDAAFFGLAYGGPFRALETCRHTCSKPPSRSSTCATRDADHPRRCCCCPLWPVEWVGADADLEFALLTEIREHRRDVLDARGAVPRHQPADPPAIGERAACCQPGRASRPADHRQHQLPPVRRFVQPARVPVPSRRAERVHQAGVWDTTRSDRAAPAPSDVARGRGRRA